MTDIVERLRSAALPGTNRNVIDCAAADEIERLRLQLENQKAEWLAWDEKRAALECDAARYRWLRRGDNDERVIKRGPVAHDFVYLLRMEKLDAAIDAAMKG